jgi:ATP-dependent DNA ligase
LASPQSCQTQRQRSFPACNASPCAACRRARTGRYELKLDGYRAEAIKPECRVRLISRNRKDLSAAYPEIVAVDPAGRPSFQALQHAGASIREHNLEGVITELTQSRYEPDMPSGFWVK